MGQVFNLDDNPDMPTQSSLNQKTFRAITLEETRKPDDVN